MNLVKIDVNGNPLYILSPGCTISELSSITLPSMGDYLVRLTGSSLGVTGPGTVLRRGGDQGLEGGCDAYSLQ